LLVLMKFQGAYTAAAGPPDLRRGRRVEIRVPELAPIGVQAVDVDDLVEGGELADVRVALRGQLDQAEVAVLLEVAVEVVRDDGVVPRGVNDAPEVSVPVHVGVPDLVPEFRQMNASGQHFASEEKNQGFLSGSEASDTA